MRGVTGHVQVQWEKVMWLISHVCPGEGMGMGVCNPYFYSEYMRVWAFKERHGKGELNSESCGSVKVSGIPGIPLREESKGLDLLRGSWTMAGQGGDESRLQTKERI